LLFAQADNDHPNSFSLRSHNKLTNEPIQHTLKSKRCFFDYSLCETLYEFVQEVLLGTHLPNEAEYHVNAITSTAPMQALGNVAIEAWSMHHSISGD